MTWKNRFQQLGKRFAHKEAESRQQAQRREEQTRRARDERRQQVKELARPIEKVLRDFAGAVGWSMDGSARDENGVWHLKPKNKKGVIAPAEAWKVGISIVLSPYWYLAGPGENTPACYYKHGWHHLPVRGIWLGVYGLEATGTSVDNLYCRIYHGFEGSSARPSPLPSGFYSEARGMFGYFLAMDDFSEARLATTMEKISDLLLRNG